MQLPYLEGEPRRLFDDWQAETLARFREELTFAEIRKGAQAVARLCGEPGPGGIDLARLSQGRGKRAALATYRAALRFLTTYHATQMLFDARAPVARITEIGCLTGAASAGLALALDRPPRLIGLEPSPWCVAETRLTWRALGLDGQVRRESVTGRLPTGGASDLYCLAWLAGLVDPATRRSLLKSLLARRRRGAGLLILEPRTSQPDAWWREWSAELGAWDVREETVRVAIDRPHLVRDMDKAAREDHQVIAARVLSCPPEGRR